MSAPTPISQDPADIAYEFLGKAPSAIGKVTRKAAPATHGHAMSSSPAQPIGFGLQQYLTTSGFPSPGAGVLGILTNKLLPSFPLWTIEGWIDSTTGVPLGVGFTDNGTNPETAPTSSVLGLAGGAASGNPVQFLVGGSAFAAPNTDYSHFALSCDGSLVRCYWNGALVTTFAAISTPANQFGFFIEGTTASSGNFAVDEIRLSSVARYAGSSFTVPTEPFTQDPQTVLLWHLDNSPLGEWASVSGGSYTLNTGSGAFQMEDASGNGNVGFLGAGGGVAFTISGQISTCSPTPSGRVATNAVLSLQARTGDLVLTDTAGNSVATAVPQSDGTTQLQTSLMAFKAAWSSTTAYAVGDTVTSGGLTYVCIANNTNNEPPNTTYWAAVGGGGGGTLAHTYEQEITVTTAVTALSYTPTTSGLFRISFYFRVTTAATDVTVTVTTTDATGAQTWDVLPLASEAVDSYQLDPITVAGTAGDAIDVVVTVGTANQVYFSSSIEAG